MRAHDEWHEPGPADPRRSTGPYRWRVPAILPTLKLAGVAALLVLGTAFGGRPAETALAALAAAGLAGWAARDLLAPVRLSADADGLTVVSGFAGRRRLDWSQVETIRVDARPRLGLRTETLEIDTGETLHLFGPYDLGAAPADVARTLEKLRRPPEG